MPGAKKLTIAAKAGAALLLGAGALTAVAAPASAAVYGNKIWNCYGIYWTTDWNQECGSGGALKNGNYQSEADCTGEFNEEIIHYRKVGNTTSYDGPDCTWEVADVTTWYGTP